MKTEFLKRYVNHNGVIGRPCPVGPGPYRRRRSGHGHPEGRPRPDTGKTATYKARRAAPTETSPAGTLTSELWPPQPGGNDLLLWATQSVVLCYGGPNPFLAPEASLLKGGHNNYMSRNFSLTVWNSMWCFWSIKIIMNLEVYVRPTDIKKQDAQGPHVNATDTGAFC